jgi:hypothetical protein
MCTRLQVLNLARRGLTGCVPDEIGRCVFLKEVRNRHWNQEVVATHPI